MTQLSIPQDNNRGLVSQAPAHIAQCQETGAENLSQYIVPPRLKLIQPTTGGEYAEKFNVGDAILVPQLLKIIGLEVDPTTGRPMPQSSGVRFTPLFFFAEYCLWNPYKSGVELPMIRERSYDSKSVIAVRAKDAAQREMPCPDAPGKMMRYVEHLNFLVSIHSPELQDLPVLMSFARSEHRYGTNFMTLLQMRRAAIFGCNFQFTVRKRTNKDGQVWYGLDVENPADNAWVENPDRFEANKIMFEQLKKGFADKAIQVEFDDPDMVVDAASVVNPDLQ